MKKHTLLILQIFSISFCQAQISIGPTVGLNYSFVELQNSSLEKLGADYNYKFHKKSKPAPFLGLKMEIPVNRSIFISINSNFFKSSNKINYCFLVCDSIYFDINQILIMSSLNYTLSEQISIGLGTNFLFGSYNNKFLGIIPDFRDVGIFVSSNYKFKQFVFELLYIQSLKSFGSKLSDDTFILKPINNLQLSISYLFKVKLGSGEKDIKCPRF